MSDYPEHAKLSEIAQTSQAIGEFLDVGLPRMGLTIYEKFSRDCECYQCKHSFWLDHDVWGFHSQEECEAAGQGPVQIEEWLPARRTIQSILAEYFGIDQKKIDAEKDAMLEAFRSAR